MLIQTIIAMIMANMIYDMLMLIVHKLLINHLRKNYEITREDK